MFDFAAAIQQFHFLRPWWLAAMVAPLICLWLREQTRTAPGPWRQVIAPELLPFLISGERRGGIDLKPWVLAAAVICCLALAGPTWSKSPSQGHRQERALLVLLDLSPSMLAADLVPDRLTRARLKVIDLLKAYREGSAGLVAYSGDAHTVCPLTDDTNTLINLLPVLHPAIMPAAGSNPEAAVNRALELALNAGHLDGDLLLVTDGMTRDAREAIASILNNHLGFRLSVLGVGTDEGAPIPVGEQGFARDGSGAIVIAKLRSAELRGLAERSGGIYRGITGGDDDITSLLEFLATGAGGQARVLDRELDTWLDRGPWLALLLLPLAALMFRRGLFLALLIVPFSYAPESQASWWDDLWWSRDQQGVKALAAGDPERARALFEDPAWRGIAAGRAGDHRAAAEDFARMGGASGHYNRGNALARAGDLDGALDAYDQALALTPGMEDAIYNKAIVEQLKSQQQNNQSSGRTPPPDSDKGEEDSSPSQDKQPQGAQPQEKQPEQKQSQDSQSPEKQPANQSGDPRQESADRDTSRNDEQWLRRVPDDPGGLLRRKFEYEARQRFRDEGRNPRPPPGQFQEERW